MGPGAKRCRGGQFYTQASKSRNFFKVVAGEEVKLVCIATGQPAPNVTWVKEGGRGELHVTQEQTEEGVMASVLETLLYLQKP